MPSRLPERCGPDTILGFRAAAVQRFSDGSRLADTGRRTAAVYLWGYTVEMLLKAGYFSAFGYDPRRPIAVADLGAAKQLAGSVGYAWPSGGNLHHLPAWSQLLIRARSMIAGAGYSNPSLPAQITTRAVRVYQVWRETLRYHQNIAYEFEVRTARECADWFLENATRL